MLLLEAFARPLLILHAVLAAALVAATTHLALWMRGYGSGRFRRFRATQRFAGISFALYLATFAVGNLLYPTYKVRVRLEYLENADAIAGDLKAREAQAASLAAGFGAAREERAPVSGISAPRLAAAERDAARTALWFDIKEHLVFLGLLPATALWWTLRRWRSAEGEATVGKSLLAMAILACAAVWMAALIGLFTAAVRAVGTL